MKTLLATAVVATTLTLTQAPAEARSCNAPVDRSEFNMIHTGDSYIAVTSILHPTTRRVDFEGTTTIGYRYGDRCSNAKVRVVFSKGRFGPGVLLQKKWVQ